MIYVKSMKFQISWYRCIYIYTYLESWIYIYIYGIMVNKGNHPQMAARFRLVKCYKFTQIYVYIYIYKLGNYGKLWENRSNLEWDINVKSIKFDWLDIYYIYTHVIYIYMLYIYTWSRLPSRPPSNGLGPPGIPLYLVFCRYLVPLGISTHAMHILKPNSLPTTCSYIYIYVYIYIQSLIYPW